MKKHIDNERAPGAAMLVAEHGVLVRHLGALQHRVGAQMREREDRMRRLEAENLRLRAELMVLRTIACWGLGAGAVVRHTAPARHRVAGQPAGVPPSLREAEAVICQTGCVGHAHPWRDADGQCRRTGQACEPAPLSGEFDLPVVVEQHGGSRV